MGGGGGRLGRTMVRCHRCLTLLFLFRGRNSGYQIFAASLTHNASLDKPESLFTVAGYSFVAFSFEAAPAPSDSFCARSATLTYNLPEKSLLVLRRIYGELNVLDRRKILRRRLFLSVSFLFSLFFLFFFYSSSLSLRIDRKTEN